MKVKALHSFFSSIDKRIIEKGETLTVDENSEIFKKWRRRGLIEEVKTTKKTKKSAD